MAGSTLEMQRVVAVFGNRLSVFGSQSDGAKSFGRIGAQIGTGNFYGDRSRQVISTAASHRRQTHQNGCVVSAQKVV
jgi:hypothetical protein